MCLYVKLINIFSKIKTNLDLIITKIYSQKNIGNIKNTETFVQGTGRNDIIPNSTGQKVRSQKLIYC